MTSPDTSFRWVGPYGVITMPDEIDAANAPQIRQALVQAAREDTAVLVIDMSATTFCDSAGVQAIIVARSEAASTDTQLRLVATAALRILTLVGVDHLIPVYPTLEAALAQEV